MRFAIAALAAAMAFTSVALAQPDKQHKKTIVISDIAAAKLLIANHRLDDAKKILTYNLSIHPDDSETLFPLGAIAVAQKDYNTAIALYRRILVHRPDAERVRLELARAFFLKGDYDNADRQFRFARAGDISDAVKANIDHYLAAINRLREWTLNFSFALAPDTNQNAATSASQISVFGLPFTLDPNARRQSGVGVADDIGAEWSPLLFDNVKGRFGADVYRVDYSGGQFDDMAFSGHAGAQMLFNDWDVSLLANGFQRWYANKAYVSGVGGKIAVDYGITSNLLIGGSIGGQAITNQFVPAQSGPLYSSQIQAAYVLSPSSLFRILGGFNRQDAQIAPHSYTGFWFGAGYQQDLPFGFSAGFQPSYYNTRYDAPLAAFGVTRTDNAVMLSFTLLNRHFVYHGFTPRLSYVFTEQHSNIALYSYSRNQFQIGLTSVF
jgi:tetratricopeptide (TPR) repeat protein